MKQRIVGLIVIIVFFATMLGLIIANSRYIFSSQDFYTAEELEKEYKKGYDQAVIENADAELYKKLQEYTFENIELKTKNEELENKNKTLSETIASNNLTIADLNSQIEELEAEKEENEATILELTNLKNELETQNKLLAYEVSENEATIEANNTKIAQLENSIAYYENYINSLETESEVFAIFVVESEVVNVQKVNKNGLAYLEEAPKDGENYTINGWLVNGESVDLEKYTLSCNTTFVADITYQYKVDFMVDDVVYNTQTLTQDEFAVLPEEPTKDGYIFNGWSLNGVDIVNVESCEITRNIKFVALFEKITNTFVSYSWNGSNVPNGDYIWSDGVDYYCSMGSKQYVLNQETNTWENKTWNIKDEFWGGQVKVINDNVYLFYNEKQYILNKETINWDSYTWNGLSSINGYMVWFDGENVYYSKDTAQYMLNQETNTWEALSWTDLIPSTGQCIWTDGVNIYYSCNSVNYILNKETNTWENYVWNKNIYRGDYVFTNGEDYFYSYKTVHYVLDKETNTWVETTWEGVESFYGSSVWCLNGKYFCSDVSGQYRVYM